MPFSYGVRRISSCKSSSYGIDNSSDKSSSSAFSHTSSSRRPWTITPRGTLLALLTQHEIWIRTYMSQLEANNLPQTKKWFTPLTYVVYLARNLNTYIDVSFGNKQLTTNQKVVYSVHPCGSLSMKFEYIHTCLSWKQVTYHKPKSGLLRSPMWFTQYEISIHTYMSQLETSNLPQKKSGLLWSLM